MPDWKDHLLPAVNLGSGRKAVASSGTPEALGSQVIRRVIVAAQPANTGLVVVGGSQVLAAAASRAGIPLTASAASVELHAGNLADVFVDVATAAEGVTFTFYR